MNFIFAILEPIVYYLSRAIGHLIGTILGHLIYHIKQLIKFLFREAQSAWQGYYQENASKKLQAKEEALAKDREERQERHEILLKILDDEFAEIDMDLSLIVKAFPRSARMKVVEKHGGKATPIGAGIEESAMNAGATYRRSYIDSALKSGCGAKVARAVSDLTEKEIGVIKILSLLNSLMLVDNQHFGSICLTIIYNGGKSLIQSNYSSDKPDVHAALEELIKSHIQPASAGIQRGIITIGQVRKHLAETDLALLAEIDRELKGASGWMNAGGL